MRRCAALILTLALLGSSTLSVQRPLHSNETL